MSERRATSFSRHPEMHLEFEITWVKSRGLMNTSGFKAFKKDKQ